MLPGLVPAGAVFGVSECVTPTPATEEIASEKLVTACPVSGDRTCNGAHLAHGVQSWHVDVDRQRQIKRRIERHRRGHVVVAVTAGDACLCHLDKASAWRSVPPSGWCRPSASRLPPSYPGSGSPNPSAGCRLRRCGKASSNSRRRQPADTRLKRPCSLSGSVPTAAMLFGADTVMVYCSSICCA